ncbi:MAG: O-antigen/teichoic acid export membrane protein [Flavobacteriales bacterium]|jgi:O-antigen/teichoic acid export membrane protein
MIGRVISSIGSRLLIMMLTLVVVIINSKILGDEGQGTAALIQLGILLIVSVTNFIGGGAVVYLTSRLAPKSLVLPSYLWSIAISGIFFLFFSLFNIVPQEFIWQICCLGLIQALFTFHMQVAMGKEHIHSYNIIVTIQAFILASTLVMYMLVWKEHQIESYIKALFASFSCTYIIALGLSLKFFKSKSKDSFGKVFKELWNYGKFAQAGNILQLLNYRSNLFLLEKLALNGRGAAGVFSIGLYAGEAVWNVGKSLAIVQYARISNSTDRAYNQRLSLTFLYISAVASLVLILIMIAFPDSFYQWVFGEEMAGLHSVLVWFAPGIFANALSMIFSHHFSGLGQHFRNTISSGAGLVMLLICGFILIPLYQVDGAAMAASAAYITQLMVLGGMFMKEEKVGFGGLIPKRSWFIEAIGYLKDRSKK